jgi:peptidyl-prolyl cis-trans isomerase D
LAKQENEQFAQAVGAAESAAYYDLLKGRFKAEILVPRPSDPTVGAER